MDKVRVLRIVEYVGPRGWVEDTIKGSIHGERVVNRRTGAFIRATTLGTFPEIMDDAVARTDKRPVEEQNANREEAEQRGADGSEPARPTW